MRPDNDRYPKSQRDGRFVSGDTDCGTARDVDRQVLIRLDPAAYSRLSMLALLDGVAPTTKARMLLRGALAEALRERIGPV